MQIPFSLKAKLQTLKVRFGFVYDMIAFYGFCVDGKKSHLCLFQATVRNFNVSSNINFSISLVLRLGFSLILQRNGLSLIDYGIRTH